MNIFVLHYDPAKIPSHYCDRHLGKLMIECCQILNLCKRQHSNSKWIPWAEELPSNYNWLLALGKEMYKEWINRGFNKHKSGDILNSAEFKNNPFRGTMKRYYSCWPMVMPDTYIEESINNNYIKAIMSYRRYYADKMRDFRRRGIGKLSKVRGAK